MGKLTTWAESTFGLRFKGDDDIDMAKISRIGISTTIKTDELQRSRTYKLILASFEDWWLHTESWIQIFAAKHVVTLNPRRRSSEEDIGLSLRDNDDWIDRRRRTIGFPEMFSIPVTRHELAASLRLAGQDITPPLEWTLIRDAQYQVRLHDFRRAIIDAGTAAELAITRMIDRKLTKQGHSEGHIESVLTQPRNRTLGGRVNLLQRLNAGSLPPRFYDIVVAKRNAAAHEGTRFRRIEAERAVLKARRVVEKAAPLDAYLPKAANN